jgi:hypothetical protein
MTTPALSPDEAARWARRAGLTLQTGRHTDVAATANHIQHVIGALREVDFGQTAPATTYHPERERTNGAV